jgi:GNAT superfamily N-acetyltransferase
VEIKEFRPEDAAALARLYQASDAGWPFPGFAEGLLFPAEDVLRDLDQERALNNYLAWAEGRAVGFANLMPTYGEEGVGYLGLLTADPSYHGRGVGRDLIRQVLRRCVQLGLKRLDLDTWRGNTRAVPLYKKTGFHWGPGRDVLVNFMPLLLSHPLTRGYFEATDWYACLRRDLSLELDEGRRGGALVFEYEWDGPAGRLRAVFDQRTRAPVKLDTPDLRLSLDLPAAELLSGEATTVRLRVENRRLRPVQVALRAVGDGPVEAGRFEGAVVEAGQSHSVEWEATGKAGEAGDGAVKVSLLVDGYELELAASLKVLAPLELALEPPHPVVRAGAPARVALNVRNRLSEPVEVELTPDVGDDVDIMLDAGALRLGAGEVAGASLEVRARAGGAHRLALGVTRRRGERAEALPPLQTELVSVGPGEVVAARRGNTTRLICEEVILEIPSKGMDHTLLDRRTGSPLVGQGLELGPPFWPTPLEEQEFEVSVDRAQGVARATLRAGLKEPSGVHLERAYTLAADGEAAVTVRLANLGVEARELQLGLRTIPRQPEREAHFPLEEGVVRGQGGRPAWPPLGPSATATFRERWVALGFPDWTVGVLWPEGLTVSARYFPWGRLGLRGPKRSLAPGETLTLGEVRLTPTRGGWREVARAWR